MSKLPLKWGLISTARINRALIPPIRQSERSTLSAVASRDEERARAYAREWKIPKSFASYADMLSDPDIDVVYISLPNSLHAEWTIKALLAGKHVLCEKPLAVSLEEVDAIIQTAHQAGLVVAEAFMYRHHPQTLRVQELVSQGALGNLQLVRGAFTYTLNRPGDVRLDPEVMGGSIWDVGCYPISYGRMILGLEPVEAFGWQVRSGSGVDESFTGQLRFPGDRFLQFDSSFRSPNRKIMEIIGSEGLIRLNNAFTPTEKDQIYLDRRSTIERISVRNQELYCGEVEDMESSILNHRPSRISLEDSRGNVAAILALLESAHTGKPVSL